LRRIAERDSRAIPAIRSLPIIAHAQLATALPRTVAVA
jgi:hypothetical protein